MMVAFTRFRTGGGMLETGIGRAHNLALASLLILPYREYFCFRAITEDIIDHRQS